MNKYNGITMGAGITLASFLIPISSIIVGIFKRHSADLSDK